jgi:hypothetical protein
MGIVNATDFHFTLEKSDATPPTFPWINGVAFVIMSVTFSRFDFGVVGSM